MRVTRATALLSLIVLAGCNGGGGRHGRDAGLDADGGLSPDGATSPDSGTNVDSGPRADAGTSADSGTSADAGSVDAGSADAAVGEAATLAQVVQCGPNPVVGPGNAAEFQRNTVNTGVFPDALCNDGTPAVFYYRPYNGAANRNKWVINLHGGGACGSGASCVARWCSCSNSTVCPFVVTPTNFDRSNMTDLRAPMTSADGLFKRGDVNKPNPIGDYNQIQLVYCSSDSWHGTRRAVRQDAVNPKTGDPVSYTIHFLGARILDADIATLRQDGAPALSYTLGTSPVAMPDLDEASEVVFSGDSAGGSGLDSSLDYLTDTLRAHNVNCTGGTCPLRTYGLMDAALGPAYEPLDYSTFVEPTIRSYTDYINAIPSTVTNVGARVDASCLAWHAAHAPATAGACYDREHVIRNHVTTPFFERTALADALVSSNYFDDVLRNPDGTLMTIASFALTTHNELRTFTNLSATAEEGSAITKQPGVFAPACTKHDTILEDMDTFGTTITPPGGTPQRLLQIFANWQAGTGITNILTESPTRADTFCP